MFAFSMRALYGIKQALGLVSRLRAYAARLLGSSNNPQSPYLSGSQEDLTVCACTDVLMDYSFISFYNINLMAYSENADWIGVVTTHRSTSGYYVFLEQSSLLFRKRPNLLSLDLC
ncbi:hypothetical protein Tco_0531333 [Tanacetum coccineum]